MFVSLLGSPRIIIGQSQLTGLRRKNCALVYFIAAHREAITRDQLLALFWPDFERPSAQQILRTMLHDLRKQLGDDFLRVEEGRLSLFPSVQVDVTQFIAALSDSPPDRAALASALELYRGEFLDGFTLADAPAFDDWVVTERGYYRAQALRGYAALARLYEADRRLPDALDAIVRGLAIDPLQEELQREALRLHYLTGDRAGAIRRYDTLRKLLDDELGVPPMPETRSLYDAIISDSVPASLTSIAERPQEPSRPSFPTYPAQTPAPLLPLTGREVELDALNSLISSQKVILVEGAPGIGKTRLVNEFLAAWQASPTRDAAPILVMRGVAHELEQGLPYQPVVDALRGLFADPDWSQLRTRLDVAPVWWGEMTRLLPEMQNQMPAAQPASQAVDEARLWEGIHQFLESLSRLRQVVLVVDDLHWADVSTLGLIGYLARHTTASTLVLIGTTRPVDAHTRLAGLVKPLIYEDRLTRLVLSPLSAADTRAVAEKLSPTSYDLLSNWLIKSAEGNPYFLTELVRHAFQSNLLAPEGEVGPAVFSTQLLPATIQNLILSRLMRLTEDARRVLDIAAVIGREFDFDLIDCILSPSESMDSEEMILNALQELQVAVLIQPAGVDHFTFDHSLTMEVVLNDIGDLRTRRLHRQVASALETLHARKLERVAGIIARHYFQGGAPDRAGPFAYKAGSYAAGLAAWVEAVDYYGQALSTDLEGGLRAGTLIGLGTARIHTGEFTLSSDAFKSAAELARQRHDLTQLEAAYMGWNQSLLPPSRYEEAIRVAQELAESGPPELAICAQYTWAAALSVGSSRPDEAEVHLREVERLLAEQPGYTGFVTLAYVKYQLASVAGQQGDSHKAVALYREALAIVRRDETKLDLLRQIMLYNNLAYHLSLTGDLAAADEAVRSAIQMAQERGSMTHMPYLLSTLGEIALAAGRLEEAEGHFTEGLRLAELVPMPERIAGIKANLGLVACRRGLDDLGRRYLQEALVLAKQLDTRHLAVRIRIWLAPLLPPDEARARLEEAQKTAEESGFRQLLVEIAQIQQEITQR